MIPFVLAFAVVQAAAWFWGTYETALGQRMVESETWRGFFLPVVLIPVASAWIGAEVAVLLRPFDKRKRTPLVHLLRWSICGLLAGGATIAVEGVALTINAERVSDSWIMALAPFAVAFGAVAVFPRASITSGCPACGYDWKGLGRCPECGTAKA